MTIKLFLLLVFLAIVTLPDPGERPPELLGIPVIMWLLGIGMALFAAWRYGRIAQLIYEGWEWLSDLWWKVRR